MARSAKFTVPEGQDKKSARDLLSHLHADIDTFRYEQFPPEHLEQLADMPIYRGTKAQVRAYQDQWQPLIDRALAFYPSAYLPPDELPLPASLEIPVFYYAVERLHLTRTRAKESKSFGSVGACVAKCGDFDTKAIDRMEKALAQHEGNRLVAHREFIDLRAYLFCRSPKGEEMPPQRLRFYRTGLIVATLPNFEFKDNRKKPRKKRNDAYNNPLGDNDIWKVYVRYAKV